MNRALISLLLLLALAASTTRAADWRQFMGDPAHTGDAADEQLRLPLGLVAQVRLDDAVMTARGGRRRTRVRRRPDGRRLLHRPLPTAVESCGAPRPTGRARWASIRRRLASSTAGSTTAPPPADSTSSTRPREKLLKRSTSARPILSAPTAANGSIYFQAMDAVLRCIDPDGAERWRWDHYARYREPADVTRSQERERGHPRQLRPPPLRWRRRGRVRQAHRDKFRLGPSSALTREPTAPRWPGATTAHPPAATARRPMSSSIAGRLVYNAGMGADGELRLTRLAMADGRVGQRGRRGKTHCISLGDARGPRRGRDGRQLVRWPKRHRVVRLRRPQDARLMAR